MCAVIFVTLPWIRVNLLSIFPNENPQKLCQTAFVQTNS